MSTKTDELRDWWAHLASEDAARSATKAEEYGSYDLVLIGRTLAELTGFELVPGESEEETHAELGIWFYLLGKVARWAGAMKDGRRPSDDTITDVKIYATMIQRVRAVGGWPFGPDSEQTITHANTDDEAMQVPAHDEPALLHQFLPLHHIPARDLINELIRRGLVQETDDDSVEINARGQAAYRA